MSSEPHPPVACVGSVVRDHILRVEALPMPGESVVAREVLSAPGGKGANQAAAAARLGAPVFFLGKVGEDEAGREAGVALEAAGVDAVLLVDADEPTGEASVVVDEEGENLIVVRLGANLALRPEELEAHRDRLAASKVLVTQLEIPAATVRAVADLGADAEVLTILNAAPLPPDAGPLLAGFDLAVLNRMEAEILAGVGISTVEDAYAAVRAVHEMGVAHPIVTLGPAGAAFLFEGRTVHAPSPPVEAVDATGAGDAFVGALATGLAGGLDVEDAVARACRAAALATKAVGARAGHPDADALAAFERTLEA